MLRLVHDQNVLIRVRDYLPSDEPSWLRCRALSFLDTAYYDDVFTAKPRDRTAELVAESAGRVVGLLDLSVEGSLATLETIAVLPEYRCRGVGTDMFDHARARALVVGATTIDAWTRDDAPALRWYARRGFAEEYQYLHVYADHYANPDEPGHAVDAHPGLQPIRVLLHVGLDKEKEMRTQFTRVYTCRRFVRPI